jgi:hypothetical protein
MATIEVQIGSVAADITVFFLASNSTWNLDTLIDDQVGYWYSDGQKQGVGLYFASVAVPKYATIDTAYLKLVSSSDMSANTVNTRITGEKQASVSLPAIFTDTSNYQSRRGTVVGGANNNYITSAQVTWDSIASWTDGTTYNSPEIKTVIQEIINLSGWNTGQSMVVFWDDHEGRTTATDGTRRTAYNYDISPTYAPILHIEYTPGSAPVTSGPGIIPLSKRRVWPTRT